MTLGFIFPLLLSFAITFITTPLTIRFFKKRGWVEDPVLKQAKTGNATALYPTPRGGGIPLLLGLVTSLVVFLPLDGHLRALIFACLLTVGIGVVDDIFDISPRTRLITNILSALIIISSGIGIAYLSNPFSVGVFDLSHPQITFNLFGELRSIWVLSDLLALFWIVWATNFVGWSAGVEGQLPGYVAISAIFIGLLGLKFSSDITQWPLIILAAALAGSYLGFLPYNFFPQKIMPGYSGKSLAGLVIGVLAILSGAKLATVAFLLAVPLLDSLIVLIRRLVTRRPLTLSDGYHLHHYLLKIGWPRPVIALTYWLFSLLFGIISLSLNSSQKLVFFSIILVIFTTIILRLTRRI
ncbi:MAG: MraY family glycosyltransferase [Candidatus Shapirobacteria bacterium]